MEDIIAKTKMVAAAFAELYSKKELILKETGEAVKEINDVVDLAKTIVDNILKGK